MTIQAASDTIDEKRQKRNFFGGMWHGVFLATGIAFTEPSTVIAAFVAELTGSTIWVGAFTTVLTIASTLPQLFIARWIEPRRTKMPALMIGIYLRVSSWALLAWMIYVLGSSRPELLAWMLVGLLAVFYAGGGIAGIPYTDIIGKVISINRRGAFFGGKEALAGPLAAGVALLTRSILVDVAYPDNYALLFGLAAGALLIASVGFWLIKEPPGADVPEKIKPWRMYLPQLAKAGRQLKNMIIVQLLTGFSLMVLPFYVVYARSQLDAPIDAVGWFLLFQVLGGVLGNLVWARLVDRVSSRTMLTVCAITSTLALILALAAGRVGWMGLLPVFLLAGAAFNGRKVGF